MRPDPLNPDSDSPLQKNDAVKLKKSLVFQASLNAALINVARSGSTDFVEKTLEMGADANFCDGFGLTALHLAANAGNTRMIKLLVRHGAKISGCSGINSMSSGSGLSVMSSAALNNRLDAVKLLASYAMDMEQAQPVRSDGSDDDHNDRENDQEMTLLEMTLVSGNMKVATWLIDNGADIECKHSNELNKSDESNESSGESLLDRMVFRRNEAAVFLLISSGAQTDPRVVYILKRKNTNVFSRKIKLIHQFLKDKKYPSEKNGSYLFDDSINFKKNGIDYSSALKTLDYLKNSRLRGHWSEKIYRYLPTRATGIMRNNDVFSKFLVQGNLEKALEFFSSRQSSMDLARCSANGLTASQLLSVSVGKVIKPFCGADFDGSMGALEKTVMDLFCVIEKSFEDLKNEHCEHGEHIFRLLSHAKFKRTGNTVLHELIARGHSRLTMHLLQLKLFKGLVNTSNHDLSRPLHLAVQRQDPELLSALVRAGANLNAFDRQGHTPLHVAAFMLEHPCAQTAVALGSNIDLPTRTGMTLEQIIDQRKGQSEIFKGMIHARRAIDCAKSIFSVNNPMSMMVRAKKKNIQ